MNKISNIKSRVTKRIRDERGFTMIPAMMAVMVGSLVSLGAWTAAHSDVKLQNNDRYGKIAYSQAESGVSDYVQHMAEDAGYWQYCDSPPGQGTQPLGIGETAINDTDKNGVAGTTARRWLPQPTIGSPADAALTEQYTIDLIPANGQPSCKAKANRNESMVDKTTGVIRVRVTGRAGPPVPYSTTNIANWRQTKWKRRSIVIEFRRKGFLDYAYFTDREGKDPAIQPAPQSTNCATYYSPLTGATNQSSRFYWNGNSGRPECGEIQFADADAINGPFHTNDGVYLASSGAGAADFGRAGRNDAIEVYDAKCPFRTGEHAIPATITDTASGNAGSSRCTNSPGTVVPNLRGPLRIGSDAGYLALPESNEDLLLYADDNAAEDDYHGYTYYGTTQITLKTGGVMDVINNGNTETNKPYPPSGVIYVANSTGVSSCDHNPDDDYPALPVGCGLAEVKGTYDEPLTITSDADVVITGNLRKSAAAPAAVLGLIGNMFVRIRHYASAGQCGNTTNTSGNARVEYVDAAILTLHHSFTVDWHKNTDCNTGSLGTLHLTGVLAQAYRGIVNSGSGYTKDYNYDDRYKYLTPPKFLVPTSSTWRISRYREQVPACACT